jgi:hypothetical protein
MANALILPDIAGNFYTGMDRAAEQAEKERKRQLEEEQLDFERNVLVPFKMKQMAQQEKNRGRQEKEWERQKVVWGRQDTEWKQAQSELAQSRSEKNEDRYLVGQAYAITKATVPGPGRDKAIEASTGVDGQPASPGYKARLAAHVANMHKLTMDSYQSLDDSLKRDTRTMFSVGLNEWPEYASTLVERYGPEAFEGINLQPRDEAELGQVKRTISMKAGQTSSEINAAMSAYGGSALDQKDAKDAMKRLTALQELKSKALAGMTVAPGDVIGLRMAGFKDLKPGDQLPNPGNSPEWAAQIDNEINYYRQKLGMTDREDPGQAEASGGEVVPGNPPAEVKQKQLDDFFNRFGAGPQGQEPPGGNALGPAGSIPAAAPAGGEANTDSVVNDMMESFTDALAFKVNLATILGGVADKGTNAMVTAVQQSPEVAEAVNQYALRTNKSIGQAIVDLAKWMYTGQDNALDRASRYRIE